MSAEEQGRGAKRADAPFPRPREPLSRSGKRGFFFGESPIRAFVCPVSGETRQRGKTQPARERVHPAVFQPSEIIAHSLNTVSSRT